ncbi:MAG: hypothetical protein CL912_09540 [Deltaproteobacteria bacterium]|nr:hypothetical protein [Deltaproteobacteria bacterium]
MEVLILMKDEVLGFGDVLVLLRCLGDEAGVSVEDVPYISSMMVLRIVESLQRPVKQDIM